MKKLITCLLSLNIFLFFSWNSFAYAESVTQVVSLPDNTLEAKSAILMETNSANILYELNKDVKLPIASVTKTMTMLLVMEALEHGKIKLDDVVSTSDHASSMGGSQIFLKPGEKMSVSDMLKGVAVSSGNDCAVALAEFISGSEPAFVELMNKRANEIGALNTHFINCNGLNETQEHYSTALDVALISRQLLKYPKIHEYLTIWMDTLRDGKFGLLNTNRLIRFYEGANGIKTGSTDVAKYCLSASAKRGNMQLISVVLGAPSSNERFGAATRLLDYGFANFSLVDNKILGNEALPTVKIRKGCEDFIQTELNEDINLVVKKGSADRVKKELKIDKFINAPVKKGAKIGEIFFTLDGEEIGKRDLVCAKNIKRTNLFKTFVKLAAKWIDF